MYVTLIHADRERERESESAECAIHRNTSTCDPSLYIFSGLTTGIWEWPTQSIKCDSPAKDRCIWTPRTVRNVRVAPRLNWDLMGLVGGLVGWLVGFRGGFLLAGYNPATGAFARGGSRQYGGRGGTVAWFINHHILSSGLVKINLGLVYHQQIFNAPGLEQSQIFGFDVCHALVPLITLQSQLIKVKFLPYCKYRIFSRALKELHNYSWFLSHV